MKSRINKDAAVAFAAGYNAHASMWNCGESDGGKCSLRGTRRIGYEACRRGVLQRQVSGELGIKVALINADEAASMPFFITMFGSHS